MPRILIVDDEAVNRELLHAYLEDVGTQLIDADSGEAALELAAEQPPDLVLLDVMLPGISGFETVERLKAAHRDQFLPIILVTALADQESRVRGLHVGADEFLTKPVDRHELLLRMGNLLSLRSKEMWLIRGNVELAELQRFREDMSAMIVHDLKNPLSVILANLDFALEDPTDLQALRDSRAAGERMMRLLGNLLDVARLEAGQLHLKRARASMANMVNSVLSQRNQIARSRGIRLLLSHEQDAEIFADVDLLTRVVENVFDNAFRHTPPGGMISVRTLVAEGGIELRIGNTGAPIPPMARERIFEKFGQATTGSGRMNLGLGLYFCRLATEAHGGQIWVEETSELPTVFGLRLPH